MANQSENHSKLVNQTLLEIGKRFPDVVAWKNHTGQAFTPGSVTDALNCIINGGTFKDARGMLTPIRFGIVGQADISGIFKPSGRRLEIEVKTGEGRLSDEQQNFRAMIEAYGGIHIELRDLKGLDVINQSKMDIGEG